MSSNTLGERIQAERKRLDLTRNELAQRVGISHTQMARYETQGVQPPADVLKRLSDVFGVTIDHLVTGGGDARAKEGLKDAQLIKQFQHISALQEKDRAAILRVIEAFIRDARAKEAYA